MQYKTTEKQAALRPHTYSLEAASFNVACRSTNKSWWMGDCYLSDQFVITARHFTGSGLPCKDTYMQNPLKSIKPELLAPALGGGREDGGGGSTWNHQAECFMLRGAGNPTAPARNSTCPQRQPGLGSQWLRPATTRCTGAKGFCRSQPGWTNAKSLSSCSDIWASCLRSFTVPGGCQPCISPADGELAKNQCLFSMIQLQSPELTLADSSLTKVLVIQNGEAKAFA